MTKKRYIGDNFTRSGAERLAHIIEQYWKDAGIDVLVRLEPIKHIQVGAGWVVRSNIKNNFPARNET